MGLAWGGACFDDGVSSQAVERLLEATGLAANRRGLGWGHA